MRPPGSADTVCPRRPLMTQVQHWANTFDFLDVIWRLWLMRVVVLHLYTKFEVRRPCRLEDTAHDVCAALMGLVILTFDLLILKLVCESHLRWGTFLSNLGTLRLWVLELFAMHATDRQTDGQKQCLLPPSILLGHNNVTLSYHCMQLKVLTVAYL